MALKKIGALLTLDGEKEFKSAAAEINRSLKTMKSEMKMVTSEYSGNANSMAALTAKSEVLGKQYAKQTEKVKLLSDALVNGQKNQYKICDTLMDYRDALEEAEEKLEAMRKSSDTTTEELQKQEQVVESLRQDVGMAEQAYSSAQGKVEGWERKLFDAKVEMNGLTGEIRTNDKYMKEAEKSVDGTASSIDEFGNQVKEAGDESLKTGDIIKANLISEAIISGFKKLGTVTKDVVKEVASTGMEFESAFAGVKKTVDATEQEIAQFRGEIINLSREIPATTTEISAVAEAAGQLGIQNESLMGFTRTMIDLGNSTNVAAEDAASSLAKFANITGMSQQNFDRLGSTIVSLGNHFATTEADIIDMSTRIAAAGHQVNMSEAEIMGLATALSSVGMEAEAGGSAFSKAMVNIQLAVETGSEALSSYAEVAGMSAEEFSRAWREDAAGALSAFITGLGDTSRLGSSTIAILDEMGITEVRLRDSLLRASSANDVFTRALEMGNAAWEQNTALTDEASQRYVTAESKTQMLRNSVDALCITAYDRFRNSFVHGVESATTGVDRLTTSVASGRLGNSIERLGKGFESFTDDVLDFAEDALPVAIDGLSWIMDHSKLITAGIAGIGTAMAINKGISVVEKGVQVYRSLSSMITAASSATAVQTVATTAQTAATVTQATATGTATVAQAGLNTTMAANPIGIVITAVGGLVAALSVLSTIAGDSKSEMDEYAESMAQAREEAEQMAEQTQQNIKSWQESYESVTINGEAVRKLADDLITLSGKENKSASDKQRMRMMVDQLNDSVDGLNLVLNEETYSLNMSADAINNSIDAMIQYKKAEKIMDNMAEVAVELSEAEYELAKATDAAEEATGKATQAKKDYDDAKGKGITLSKNMTAAEREEYAEVSNSIIAYGAAQRAEEDAIATKELLADNLKELQGEYDRLMEVLGDTTSLEDSQEAHIELNGTVQTVSGEMATAANKLQEEYNETYKELSDSVNSQIGLFDELSLKSELSIRDMINNLDSQSKAMEQWATNIKIAAERGIDQGLIAELNDGSVESAKILNEIVHSSDEEIAELNASFKKTSEAKTTLITNMTEAKTGFIQQVQEMVSEGKEEAYAGGVEVGKNVAYGSRDGIEAHKGEAVGAARSLGKSVSSAYANSLEIRSPSRIIRRLSRYVPEGAAAGITENANIAVSAVRTMSKQMEDAYQPEFVSDTIASPARFYQDLGSKGSAANYGSIQIYFQPQSMSEADLDRCFNYVNRKFGYTGR